jgi:hypothetical protein
LAPWWLRTTRKQEQADVSHGGKSKLESSRYKKPRQHTLFVDGEIVKLVVFAVIGDGFFYILGFLSLGV